MTSAYEDLFPFMLMSLISIMNGHMFQSTNEHKELELDQPLSTQDPISISKCLSNLYPDNSDNSIMEKKQGEM